MDIAGLSMALSQTKLQNDVGVAMLKNSMDLMKQQGAEVAQMVAEAPAPAPAVPDLGASIDVKL